MSLKETTKAGEIRRINETSSMICYKIRRLKETMSRSRTRRKSEVLPPSDCGSNSKSPGLGTQDYINIPFPPLSLPVHWMK